MKSRFSLISVAFCVLAIGISSCEKEDNDTIDGGVKSFTANVGGEIMNFQDPSVMIKTIRGSYYTQEIIGYIIKDGKVTNALTIVYSGTLAQNNSNKSYTEIMCIYYENDYKDAWSKGYFGSTGNLIITDISKGYASGYLKDVTVVGNLGSIEISDINFNSIPIERIRL